MEFINRCVRCILPQSLPSAKLDHEGVCNLCRTYEQKSQEWKKKREDRQKQFNALVVRVKNLQRPYDCLVPLSGGKDSTYALYYCSVVQGLKCLCVTFDNGYLSDQARVNIDKALSVTGADHMYYRFNRETMLDLYRLSIEKCGNFCQVCMRGIDTSIDAALRAFNIPMVVHGTGARIAYDAVPEVHQSGDFHFFSNVVRGEKLECDVRPLLNQKLRQESAKPLYKYRFFRGLLFKLFRIPIYGPVPLVVPFIPLYDWTDISPGQRADGLKAMGWQSPPNEFEHMDCRVHELLTHIHTLKFPELTRATFYRSGLIREGLMTREEALRAEENDLAKPKKPAVLESFLKEIQMSEQEFEAATRDWKRMERFRS